MRSYSISILSIILFVTTSVFAQDSTAQKRDYTSYGFQVSYVSGMGISYGRPINGRVRLRVTAGVLSTEDKTSFSFGGDVHYFLTKDTKYNIFIGGSLGSSGSSVEDPKPRIAYSTGIEVPVSGDRIFDNVSIGAVLYYPTYFMLSKTISLMAGAFIYYNF